ncbi:methylated-DNA--[protein]-cysteine S-methyltransferase [Ramlibacter henchirensis]|uniref:Methylated-DNA--[protein]-cysteine S-methyltransferase n=1 Tax=Ramlibacter henchirensis TaxID=204072 RepID=A0A4Z0BRN1_9BURK|nr:methylated-DNA--[protein]-cysteine S-methyltransferase [Ramlibacter henchirensis]TFZ00908.1 methylated-DNA--[protein]-cysteine S-methyltransferase [Ramlibacter henchirensis]
MASAVGCCLFDTAIGRCGIAWTAAGAVQAVQLPESTDEKTLARLRRRGGDVPESAPPPVIAAVIGRVHKLLQGERDPMLDVELDYEGVPPFQQRVYEAARAIAPGKVKTYGELARELGDAGASRAVGQALGHNPFAPVVPCHRILAAHGASGGFSAEGGAVTKLRLLEIERAVLSPQGPGLFDEA